jgi:hypothetical protein
MKLLIASHSNAYDLWHITDYFLKKYKFDIPIYLGANGDSKEEFVPDNWYYINKGEDITFSKSLISYLDELDDKYIILMLDDFMIRDYVDLELINKAFEFINENNGVYLRLVPNPAGDIKIDKNFSLIDVKAKVPYITSLQMTIWDREFLIKLLDYNFSPWEFETKAGKSKEALEKSDKFFCVNYPFVKYTHYVEKGKFFPWVKEVIKKENLKLIGNREFLTEDDMKKLKDSKFKEIVRNVLPKSLYVNLRKLLGRKEL